MHKTFFTGPPNKSDPKMGAYELNQARLSQVFEQGHYNCISSALLYTALARAYSLPVRGVMTEVHAFVDFGPVDGPRLDVETTSERGFGEVHDEKFFRDWAKDWSSSRGLRPLTIDDYKKREILPPHVLVARAMMDDRIWGKDDDTKNRLSEVAGMLAPEDADVVHNRLASYANEAKWLFEHKAFRTILRMMDVVAPFVSSVPDRFPKNEKLLSDVGWIAWHDAKALSVVGRARRGRRDRERLLRSRPAHVARGREAEAELALDPRGPDDGARDEGRAREIVRRDREALGACHDDASCLEQHVPDVRRMVRPLPAATRLAEREEGHGKVHRNAARRHAMPPHARGPQQPAPVIT